MKPKHLLIFPLLTALAVLSLGCPMPFDSGGGSADPDKKPINPLGFLWRSDNEVEAGRFGIIFGVQSYPEYKNLPPARPIFSGPGTIFFVGEQGYIPFDELEEYFGNGISGVYRPPLNDEVPPNGIKVKFACEVLNPSSDKWERSPDYYITVVRRDKPMEVYILPTWKDPYRGMYDGVSNLHRVLEDVDIACGEVYERFSFKARPRHAEDNQPNYGLKRPEGYAGDIGKLEMDTGYLLSLTNQTSWSFNYTAPANITSPLDVVAWFSVYDPWVKETHVRELTFHVKP